MQVESTNLNRPLLLPASEGKPPVASEQCRIPFDTYMSEPSVPALEPMKIDLEEASSNENQSDDVITDEIMQQWFPQIVQEIPISQMEIASDDIVPSPSSELVTQLDALPLPVSGDETDPLSMINQSDLFFAPQKEGHFAPSVEVTELQLKKDPHLRKEAESIKKSEVTFSLSASTVIRNPLRQPGSVQFGTQEAALMDTGYQINTSKITTNLTSNQQVLLNTVETPKQFPSLTPIKKEHYTESILAEFNNQTVSESIELPSIPTTNGLSRFKFTTEESLTEEVRGNVSLTEISTPALTKPENLVLTDLIASSSSIIDRALQPPVSELTSPQHIPRIANQMFAHLNKTSDSATSLELSPEELGTLRFNTTPGERLSIQVLVERPETMELIRRHLDLFNKELRDMGFGNSEFTFTEHHHSPSHEQHEKMDIQDPEDQAVSVIQPAPSPKLALSTGRLDLKL